MRIHPLKRSGPGRSLSRSIRDASFPLMMAHRGRGVGGAGAVAINNGILLSGTTDMFILLAGSTDVLLKAA